MNKFHLLAHRYENLAVNYLTAKNAKQSVILVLSIWVAALAANAQPNITAAEYFFNTDPGPGNGTAVTITPGATIDLNNINIPTTSLALGWHTVCVRTRDANNIWGFYECRRIYIREDPTIVPPDPVYDITQLEFFYNSDNGPGTGTTVTITPGQTIDLVNTNLASTLPVGWHSVHVRAKNANDKWGFYESRKIYVREPPVPCCTPASSIVELEWFVDSDPGAGLSTTKRVINPSQPNIDLVDEPLDVGTQSLGAHKIYVRAKNEDGEWSMSEQANFTVITGCAIITAPSATGVSRCDPGSVTLTAAGADIGETYRWYATETSLTPLFTGNPYNTPSLAVTTTFYVTAYNPTTFCESARTPVTASLDGIPKPALSISGSLAVCEGNTQVITAPSGFVSYTWSNGLPTQQITASATGSYSVVVNNGICSSPPSDPFTFTVNARPPKPVINGTGGGSLCGTGMVSLSAPTGLASYVWSSGQTTESIDITTVGSFFVIVTNASGCQSVASDPFPVTSAALTKPTVTITGNTTLCNGSTVDLAAASGYSSYLWSNGATTQQITVSTAGSYTVVVTSGGCTSAPSDPIVVTNVSIPAKPIISVTGITALCNGAFAVLTAPAGFAHYAWSNGETTRQIVVTTAGSFTVQTGNSANCLSAASDPTTTTLTGLACGGGGVPTPAVVNASRCGEGSVQLTANGAVAGQVYKWYVDPIAGPEISTGAMFTTPSLSSTTAYYVSIFDTSTSGESNRTVATATIVTISTPVLPGPSTITLCSGGSTLLSAPTGFAQYLWSNGAVTQQIQIADAGSYTVQVGNGTCLSAASNAISVTEESPVAKPVVSVTNGGSLCGVAAVTLSAPTGFSGYLWSNGATTQEINVTTAGIFSVVVTNSTGCQSPASDNASVFSDAPAQPVVAVIGSTLLCDGNTVTLRAPDNFSSYLWSNGATTQEITVSTSNDYAVQVGNSNGCISAASLPIAVIASNRPVKPEVVKSGNVLCGTNATVRLTGPTGFATYQWSNNETTREIIVSTVGDYTLVVRNAEGCESPSSDPVTVFASPLPMATITLTEGSATFCSPATATLQAAGGSSFLWSTGSTTESISVNSSGDYSVRVTDANGCTSLPSAPFSVQAFIKSAKPIIQNVSNNTVLCGSNNSITLRAPNGFSAYQWSTNATTQEIMVTAEGNYSVMVGNDASCLSPVSDVIMITTKTEPCNSPFIDNPDYFPPRIDAPVGKAAIQGIATVVLEISDVNDDADLSTLAIVRQPSSKAVASINASQQLVVDYTKTFFAGSEFLAVRVCDRAGLCTEKEIEIEVSGDIVAFNGISPN
jgi:large repetitive protein